MTLVEVCVADVRVGSVTNLEISSSHIPYPTGFRTRRWVQLEGCGKFLPFPPPPEASPVHIKPEIPEPPDLVALVVRRGDALSASRANDGRTVATASAASRPGTAIATMLAAPECARSAAATSGPNP